MRTTFALAYSFSFDSSDGSGLYLLILVVFCLCLAIRYGLRYLALRKRLRDIKSRNVVIAEYAAPLDIPPALFGTIIDNRSSVQDIAATILHLHLKGALNVQYHEDKKDFYVQSLGTNNTKSLYGHEEFILQYISRNKGIWASNFRTDTTNIYNQFNFLVLKDLQTAGYYNFHKIMESLSSSEYYLRVILQGFIKGLIKPWNWPGFLISLIFPVFGVVWLVTSVIFYNRLGLYNYRTENWEKLWPKTAGYYNYLRTVESEKRSFELKDIAKLKIREHDPYLVAALLQPEWSHIFSDHLEIGAGGKEYNTM